MQLFKLKKFLSYLLVPIILINSLTVYAFVAPNPWDVTHERPNIRPSPPVDILSKYTFKNSFSVVIRSAIGSLSFKKVAQLLRFGIMRKLSIFASLASIFPLANYYIDAFGNIKPSVPSDANGNTLAIPYPMANGQTVYVSTPSWGSSYCSFALSYYQQLNPTYRLVPNGSNWCTLIPHENAQPEIMLNLMDTVSNTSSIYGGLVPTVVPKTEVKPELAPKTIQDEVLAAELVAKATPEQLSVLFDHTPEFQSPAAKEAEDTLNSDPTQDPVQLPYADVTSQYLDKESESTTPTETQPYESNQPKTDLPYFCTWASTVCDFIDWVKTTPDPEAENPLPIEDRDITLQSVPLSFAKSCPTAKTFSLNLGVTTKTIELPFDQFCGFLEKINPFVISIAYLHAAFIIFGRGTSNG